MEDVMLTARAMVAVYLVARSIKSMFKMIVRHGESHVENLGLIEVFETLLWYVAATTAWFFVLSGYPPRGFKAVFAVSVQAFLYTCSIATLLYRANKYKFMDVRQSALVAVGFTGLEFLLFFWSGLVQPIFELLERIRL